ncbi:hypothetical protein AB0E56_16360 [Microbacterium sp. NPDC028030]|uniref:hypothetical protein n=1 Tax=Microbacterium sp. NPDC028030 TaxID=3155124 RepID=UPI0034090BC6
MSGMLAAGAIASALFGGSVATGVEIGTLTFGSEYTCQHTVRDAIAEGQLVRQGCTYIGPMFLGWATASGPWIAVIG